jgi:hypothetical protein
MRLTQLRPSPSMAVAIVALVVSASGVTWAATSLPNNSVDSDTIVDNSVRSRDIRTDQVKLSDINRNAVAGEEVVDNTLTGDDVFEQSLGTVPFAEQASTAQRAVDADFATRAADAQQLGGRSPGAFVTTDQVVPFRVRLSFGQKVEFISNGPVGLEADCRQNITGSGQDELRLLAVTREDGAFMQGDTPHGGPGVQTSDPFLDRDTIEDERTMGGLVSISSAPDQKAADDDIDTGFVAGPNGQYIGVDETTMYALRVGGSDCLLAGLAVVR